VFLQILWPRNVLLAQRDESVVTELLQTRLDSCINTSAWAQLHMQNTMRAVHDRLDICMESKNEALQLSIPPAPERPACNSQYLRECAQTLWAYTNPSRDFPPSVTSLQRFATIPEGLIDWRVEQQLKLWQDLKSWKSSYDQHSQFVSNLMVPIEDDYVL
jgi:hypothetical protein